MTEKDCSFDPWEVQEIGDDSTRCTAVVRDLENDTPDGVVYIVEDRGMPDDLVESRASIGAAAPILLRAAKLQEESTELAKKGHDDAAMEAADLARKLRKQGIAKAEGNL